MYDHILLPTDGSDAVGPAVEAAIDLAETYDAVLHLLYVVDQPGAVSGVGEGFSGLDSLLDELEAEGERAIQRIADEARERNVETTAAIRRGNPRDDILGYADEADVDLIVMGTHGRTGVERALIGSVTETIVRHSPIQVLTVRREPTE